MALLHNLYIITLVEIISYGLSEANSTIRIAAYDPKPQPYLPEKIMTRRMGEGPSATEDYVRPPRHAQHPVRTRLPQESPSSRNLRRPLVSQFSRNRNRKRENNSTDVDVNKNVSPFILLNSESLKNPLASSADSPFGVPLQLPVGPPVATTFRSAFVGAIYPPAIKPPAPPKGMTLGQSVEGPQPPSPPVLTPAPPPVHAGPPTAPEIGSTPSPPDGSKVTDIKCIEFGGQEIFEAILSLPAGYEAVPVFEDKSMIDPTTNPACRMIPTQLVGMFQLIVSSYETCGVRKCRQSNGETWNCLVLRFPRLNGLKLPEDEIIEIRCRPHDRTADDIHVLAVATAKYADKSGIMTNKPPTVFEGLQEFECEIGLFRQLPGTNQFNSRVKDDSPLELGENVQLWSIVKDGDGWEYSKLSEVVVQKQDGVRERSAKNTAVLVFSDGCRNSNYRVIAAEHPFRDPSNNLVNKFTFRAFLFQDMEPGDSLLISAKVVGCIIEEDCRPTVCPDDGGQGYGRRRRRETNKENVMEYIYTTTVTIPVSNESTENPQLSNDGWKLQSHARRQNVTNWSRNLAIRIRMPDESIGQKPMRSRDCKLYLFISVGIALFFCMLAIAVISFTMMKQRKKLSSTSHHLPFPPPIPPSTESQRKDPRYRKKPLVGNSSYSSSDDTLYTTSEASTVGSDLLQLPVPRTVRQRKRQVNEELMGLFCNDNMVPYTSQFPPMMNYYGYMVVPRPPSSHQKKSLRAMKRSSRERSLPNLFDSDSDQTLNPHTNLKHTTTNSLDRCSCHATGTKSTDSTSDTGSQGSSHTSIIRITSSGAETISHGSSSLPRPKPRPRLSRSDNIYSEIHEDTPPTLV